ncbi:MAG: hypothetical protein ACE15F_11730 [bacterium]
MEKIYWYCKTPFGVGWVTCARGNSEEIIHAKIEGKFPDVILGPCDHPWMTPPNPWDGEVRMYFDKHIIQRGSFSNVRFEHFAPGEIEAAKKPITDSG